MKRIYSNEPWNYLKWKPSQKQHIPEDAGRGFIFTDQWKTWESISKCIIEPNSINNNCMSKLGHWNWLLTSQMAQVTRASGLVPADGTRDCKVWPGKARRSEGHSVRSAFSDRPSCSWDNASKFFCYFAMPQSALSLVLCHLRALWGLKLLFADLG